MFCFAFVSVFEIEVSFAHMHSQGWIQVVIALVRLFFCSFCKCCTHVHLGAAARLAQALFLGGEVVVHCCGRRSGVIFAITAFILSLSYFEKVCSY